MKKIAMILCSLIVTCIGYAQEKEPAAYAQFAKGYTTDFNKPDYQALASRNAASFRKSISDKKYIDFISGVRSSLGRINKITFRRFDNRGYAVYVAEMEKAWMNFYFILNDSSQVASLIVLDVNYNEVLPIVRNKTRMQWPFDTTTYIFWGGDSTNQNYHVANRAQRNAFDIVIRDNGGKDYRSNGKENSDYYIFGRRIYSPCAGKVIQVINDVKENIPGNMNPSQLTGNTVIIRSDKGEYILLAHMQFQSVVVKEGMEVKPGTFLGLCGNTGNSSEPHLHLHIMNKPTLDNATGIKCYFEKLIVNGKEINNYAPIKGERIQRK